MSTRWLVVPVSVVTFAAALGACSGATPKSTVVHPAPAAQPGPAAPPARAAAPAPVAEARDLGLSLEELMAQAGLRGAATERWQQALSEHLGSTVRWRLMSWGGELTSEPSFDTPPGGPRSPERVRFVSLELGPDANLEDVDANGHPVVVCLARHLEGGGNAHLVQDTPGREPPVPDPSVAVTLEGRLWGAVREGSFPTLWLRDCKVVAAGPTSA